MTHAQDKVGTSDKFSGHMSSNGGTHDELRTIGKFHATCRDVDGNVLWEEDFANTVVTVGKNLLLDQTLAGSAYTATVFMGLISSTSFTSIAAGDTQASHSGWLEAGSANTPTYSGTRATAAWSAASAGVKALSAGLTFTFTGSGTVQGAFLNEGGTSAIANTTGTLFSAGQLGTPQPVISTNTLTISYSITLT